jgi:hypothetical protein
VAQEVAAEVIGTEVARQEVASTSRKAVVVEQVVASCRVLSRLLHQGSELS